jgi:hypothetical protein
MTDEKPKNEGASGGTGEGVSGAGNLEKSPAALRRELLPLPGLAAIALYMMVLAAVIVLGVVTRHYPPLFLVFSASFLTASAGLMMLLRWAWALSLSAVLLLACYNLWIFSTAHMASALVQGLLNLVFFLYMIRTEVREKLR